MGKLNTKVASRIWMGLVIFWAIGRAIFVKELFGSHGVNGLIYLVVDLLSSIPYAIYSARLVVSFISRDFKDSYKNIFYTAFFFYIPDLYILIFARKVQAGLYSILFLSITVFSLIAIGTMARDIRKKRGSGRSSA